jgi:hypothetical protein
LSNKKEFDKKILVHFPLLSYEELIFNSGGVAYGYWHLAYKINSTVTVHQLKELIQDWLKEKEKIESEPLDFFDELDSYCEKKVKQLHKKTVVCYFSGEEAFPIESASSPYKVCAYSNQMQLGRASTDTNYRFASPNIKKEMALRKQCFGEDKNQKKVWVYRTIPVEKTGLLIDLDYPLLSIKAHLPSVINGGHCLFSYSITPYPIEENYLIENFPTWLYSWGCKEKGNIKDAQHILDVLDAFSCIHKVHPLGEEEESLRRHGTASNGDIGYVLHQLSKQPFNKVSCLALVKKLMA